MENIPSEKIKNLTNKDNNSNINPSPTNTKTEDEIKDEEELSLKEKYCPKYSKFQIIKKSSFFSLKNWKSILCNQIRSNVNIFFSLYLPLYKKRIIDSITKQKQYDLLYESIKKYMIFLFIRLIINVLLDVFSYYFISDSKQKYNNLFLSNLANKDIEFFDLFKTGELIDRIEKSDRCLEKNFFFHTISLFQLVFKFLFSSYYLYKCSKLLMGIYGITFITKFILDHAVTKLSTSLSVKAVNKHMDKYKNMLNEFISNIRLIKSFSKEPSEVKKLLNLSNKLMQPFNVILKGILSKCVSFINEGGETSILFFAGANAIAGKMTYGDLTIFQTYSRDLKGIFKRIQSLVYEYERILEGWNRFFEIYDYKPKTTSSKNIKPNDSKGEIKFDKVSFAYPLKPEVKILNKLSLTIPSGKTVAVVGHSGSGKTTISSLIQRFYDPNEGSILFDNTNLKDLDLTWLRNQIGIVSQEPSLCTGTIKDNILYGVTEFKQEKFDKICELTNVSCFVNDKSLFPDGYKTRVGERGTSISGGQKQRIAIARALMRDSKILIFDEATSALDAESENQVQSAIDNVIKLRHITTIIIAHRLCTVKNADLIIFLSNGKVVEKGTHKELIELDGEYKKLVKRQLIE